MNAKKRIITKTVVQTVVQVDTDELAKALGMPESTEFTVQVPGGGDWSNEVLIIGDDTDIIATYECTTMEES